MTQGLSEIVVLRPTTVFLAFLASQLPEKYVPSFHCLQTDNTAYVINKYPNDDETLLELECLYTKMFRYEISRWLGNEARNEIEKNFLDFLCCFKLEFHSHLHLLEPTLEEAHYMLQLRPRTKLLRWLNSVAKRETDLGELMEEVTLSHLVENSSVVLKNFNKLTDIKPFLKKYYKSLFAIAMSRMSTEQGMWPKIHSFEEFNHYFAVRIHTHVISFAS